MPEIDATPWSFRELQRVVKGEVTADEMYDILCEQWEGSSDIEKAKIEDTISLLVNIKYGCPVCGDPNCNKGVAYVGENMIHADKHPDSIREKRMEEGLGFVPVERY